MNKTGTRGVVQGFFIVIYNSGSARKISGLDHSFRARNPGQSFLWKAILRVGMSHGYGDTIGNPAI